MAKNTAASIKQKLLNLARTRHETFDFVFRQYVMQRIIYRLSTSKYADQFMLKGGLLFWVWNQDFHRPTQDIDLLGFTDFDKDAPYTNFSQIIQIECDDGLVFDTEALTALDIKEDAKYQGVRITGRASLERAQAPFQIDIGFGDAVTGIPTLSEIPTFLDELPKPQFRTYPVESVVAEKFQAMISLGVANSRMKDFFDIYTIGETMDVNSSVLAQAIQATFERRNTPLHVDDMYVFDNTFKQDERLNQLWQAFKTKNQLDLNLTFNQIVDHIEAFILNALRR